MGAQTRGALNDKSRRYQASGETNQVHRTPQVSHPVFTISNRWKYRRETRALRLLRFPRGFKYGRLFSQPHGASQGLARARPVFSYSLTRVVFLTDIFYFPCKY